LLGTAALDVWIRSPVKRPLTRAAGSGAFTLTINGENFMFSSVVQWNGNSQATTFNSSTQLQGPVSAPDIANAGTAEVSVINQASCPRCHHGRDGQTTMRGHDAD